jgi:hypothetical protein
MTDGFYVLPSFHLPAAHVLLSPNAFRRFPAGPSVPLHDLHPSLP